MSGDEVIFEPGDVVFGDDPFKGAGTARPWLVISNHEGKPFHGDQYIALTLTTKSWHDGLVEIQGDDWMEGGTPADSRIVPLASSRLLTRTSTAGRGDCGESG